MAEYPNPPLSAFEKIDLIFIIIRTLWNAFLTLLKAPFRGQSGSAKLVDHVKIATVRYLCANADARQFQYIAPSLSEYYAVFANKKGFQPKTITLPNGARGHWLGSPDSEKVLIWFHGGGYNLPADPLHVDFGFSLVSPTTSVIMLAYSLAPVATYPTQLQQAVGLLSYLINEQGFPVGNISLAGDSAGANLALGVLSHILHPHPQIPPLTLGGGKLNGAILLAPWATFNTNYPSVKFNAYKDIVSKEPNDNWSSGFLGGAKKDAYNEPLGLPVDDPWWNGLDQTVAELQIVGGADEILLSSIQDLTQRLQKVHPRLEFFLGEGECHDKPVNTFLGGGGKQAEAIRAFVKNKLS